MIFTDRLLQLKAGAMLIMALALCPGTSAATTTTPSIPRPPLRFEKVFNDQGEPKAIHYRVDFWSGEEVHHLEVWRQGGQLTRQTDDAIQTHARREGQSAEYELSVMDLKRKIITNIHRTNLYRIGDFTEWFDLAHGIKFPKGDYELKAAKAPAQLSTKALEACRWYALTQTDHTNLVCWSESTRIPMQIASKEGKLLWQVTKLERRVPDPDVFNIDDRGYVRNDANQDIDRD